MGNETEPRGVRGEPAHAPRRLTVELVKALKPGPTEYTRWDLTLPRFGLRVYPSGRKVYILRLRIGGRQRWLSIGAHGDPWAPETARDRALELLGKAAEGRDPAAERDLGKATPTLAEFAKRYIAEYSDVHKGAATAKGERGLLGLPKKGAAVAPEDGNKRTILQALGKVRLDAITPAQITRFHLGWGKTTPTRANRALALLSNMMTMAERWGLRPLGSNPCRRIRRFKENRRERFLSAVELAKMGEALAAVERAGRVSPFALAALRVLVFIGARLGEVLNLTWHPTEDGRSSVVDLESSTVRLSASKTGRKTLYLNPPALAVVSKLPREAGNPYVFVGSRTGTPVTPWAVERAWQVVRKVAGLEDVRLHDLRHSFAAAAVAGGQSLPVIGALLGHTTAETTKRYAHLAADPLRAASEAVSLQIEAAMKPKEPEPGKVSTLRRRGRR